VGIVALFVRLGDLLLIIHSDDSWEQEKHRLGNILVIDVWLLDAIDKNFLGKLVELGSGWIEFGEGMILVKGIQNWIFLTNLSLWCSLWKAQERAWQQMKGSTDLLSLEVGSLGSKQVHIVSKLKKSFLIESEFWNHLHVFFFDEVDRTENIGIMKIFGVFSFFRSDLLPLNFDVRGRTLSNSVVKSELLIQFVGFEVNDWDIGGVNTSKR